MLHGGLHLMLQCPTQQCADDAIVGLRNTHIPMHVLLTSYDLTLLRLLSSPLVSPSHVAMIELLMVRKMNAHDHLFIAEA